MNWALFAAGVGLAGYQAWAISVRVLGSRQLDPAERKVMIATLVMTRGLGFALGLLVTGVVLWSRRKLWRRPQRAALAPGSASYQAKLEMNGQTIPLSVTRTIKEEDGAWRVEEVAQTPMGPVSDVTVLDKATLVLRKRSSFQRFAQKTNRASNAEAARQLRALADAKLIELPPESATGVYFPRLTNVRDTAETAAALREKKVFVVPGHFFGAPEHIRIGVGQFESADAVAHGFHKLASTLRKLQA